LIEEAEQLYIDPEKCIDCDACVEACPVDAITSEDQVPRPSGSTTSRRTPPTTGTLRDEHHRPTCSWQPGRSPVVAARQSEHNNAVVLAELLRASES